MGNFITILACKESNSNTKAALIKVMASRSFQILSEEKVHSIDDNEHTFNISKENNTWTLIFGSAVPDESIAKDLSIQLKSQVFLFHIHDGDFWMYHLFNSGQLVDKFNPIPDYWKDTSNANKTQWKGSPELVSKLFKISIKKIAPYFQPWKDLQEGKKAFSTDQAPIRSEWSMVDFMEKLGMTYPEFDRPDTVDLNRIVFKKMSAFTRVKKIFSEGNSRSKE